MLKLESIRRDWKQSGSFPAHLNLFGFWDETSFLTKSGDLGAVLKISGVDYESLDHVGRDYTARRLESAFRSLNERTRLYQILFRHNRPEIPHQNYEDSLVQGAVSQRTAFLESKADRLYTIEIYWVLMIDGNYAKASLLHAFSQLPNKPGASIRELRSLLSGNRQRKLLYGQVERDRLLLEHDAKRDWRRQRRHPSHLAEHQWKVMLWEKIRLPFSARRSANCWQPRAPPSKPLVSISSAASPSF